MGSPKMRYWNSDQIIPPKNQIFKLKKPKVVKRVKNDVGLLKILEETFP